MDRVRAIEAMTTNCTLGETGDLTCLCPLTDVMDLLGKKYTMQIVCIVGAHGTVRFGTVEDHLPGASTSTLSARLEALVEAGLIERRQYDEIPPRVEYELTDEGLELGDRLRPLLSWVEERGRNEA
jgi:DNA-binding HxlR family transcriptional regulator